MWRPATLTEQLCAFDLIQQLGVVNLLQSPLFCLRSRFASKQQEHHFEFGASQYALPTGGACCESDAQWRAAALTCAGSDTAAAARTCGIAAARRRGTSCGARWRPTRTEWRPASHQPLASWGRQGAGGAGASRTASCRRLQALLVILVSKTSVISVILEQVQR